MNIERAGHTENERKVGIGKRGKRKMSITWAEFLKKVWRKIIRMSTHQPQFSAFQSSESIP